MAEQIVEGAAKLQLDDVTGEMVSKTELKKRQQKRAKKAKQAEIRDAKAAESTNDPEATKQKTTPAPKAEETPSDPEAMFKVGFLSDVYNERPSETILTRFPPEPNGYLHLGHAKAIAVNFGFAKYRGGKTVLRFDDTNPDAEEEKYFVAIEEVIKWLGFTPHKITYSSDNFRQLYEYAIILIQKGKAYVCHCGDADIKHQRGGKNNAHPRYRCEHAEQKVAENLQKFRDMREGKYAPQTAFLRMKQDITSGNPQMWDVAAYRIPKDQHPHFKTGTEWCIYPTYDFAHCLCDSIEGISHSLCTTEFILSRESYEWLNSELGVYEPMQREYGRLNLEGTIMSKRKLKDLVEKQIIRGWDDPRIYTLIAIRRRGVPAAAILSFINELGVTTARTFIQTTRFEQSIRRYLEVTVPRLMLVLDPIPVVIENYGESKLEGQHIKIPFSPKNNDMGSYETPVTQTVYIDRSDFREVDSKDYFRLAPGKSVGLLQVPYPIKATSFTKDEVTGAIQEIKAVFEMDEPKKPKTFIHWVPEGSRKAEVRIYNPLFKSTDPDSAEGGFLNDVNPDSEKIHSNALISSGLDEVRRTGPWPKATPESEGRDTGPESIRFQAMRVAYLAMDKDSTEDKLVFNRIVSLKEDSKKA